MSVCIIILGFQLALIVLWIVKTSKGVNSTIYNNIIVQARGSCTPVITSYSRPHNMLTYNITWRSASCNRASIIQYQIQVARGCTTGSTQTQTLTGNNETTALLVILSCEMNCYLRIRAEMSGSSYTDYSACIIINDQLMQNEREIQEYYEAACVPIRGVCSDGFSAPDFFINGHLTPWPLSGVTLYNITYSAPSRSYSFCFNNITADTVLTEFCHFTHAASCSLCSADSGEIEFLSYSEILVVLPTVQNDTVTYPSTEQSVTTNHSDFSYQNTITPTPTNIHPIMSTNNIITESDNVSLLTIVGAASIGAVCLLIVIVIPSILIATWCHKSLKSNTGNNMYDEPSLPDPIYQELEDRKKSDVIMEMVKNDSYGQVLKTISGDVSVLNY